jgi:hypothetical protein
VPKQHDYTLKIDLNALNHLGINLYSNAPAVISEVVANSWDADAMEVNIAIDAANGIIKIVDDGAGMSRQDMNDKYLTVGYQKREKEGTKTAIYSRHVMGRKGIGKLSLFSIANVIEVRSAKNVDGKLLRNGFVMRGSEIEKQIRTGQGVATYHPEPIAPKDISITKGTQIALRDLKKDISASADFLRKRLARRFSIIGVENKFAIIVNGTPISFADRDYFPKLEYVWLIGNEGDDFLKSCSNVRKHESLTGIVDGTKKYTVSGWVGTFDEQKSIEEGNNTIVVQAWGKLIHEDILKDIKEGGLFTKYLIGEIRADFLDSDTDADIVTSDRQRLQENDPRFRVLKHYVQDVVLKQIQSKWRDWRNEGAEQRALLNPKIKEWFNSLTKDNRRYAKQLFVKIETFPVSDPDVKRELYRQSILAFETLALKGNLSVLDQVSTEKDLELFSSIFSGMDELEMVHYYQIVQGRLAVLKKFENILPEAKEKVIQLHIFEHLWLLDPSWERASTDARMEKTVLQEFKGVDAQLTKDEKKGRIDIKYRTAAGKHIVIELKKYDRKVDINDLVRQIRKYRTALNKCLKSKLPNEQHNVELICVLGCPPEPFSEDKENREQLKVVDARYITYDELIHQTRDSYREFIEAQKEITRIQALISSI